MATNLFFRNIASDLGGSGQFSLGQRRGSAQATAITNTTNGGTNIPLVDTPGGTALTWFSGQISTSSVTVAGSIFVNLRGLEGAAANNAGLAILIEKTDSAGTVISTVVPRQLVGGELNTPTQTAQTLTVTPTSTTFSSGQRFKVTISVINVGVMGAGTMNFFYNGRADAIAGDSYFTLTENMVTDDIQDVSPFEIKGTNAYYG